MTWDDFCVLHGVSRETQSRIGSYRDLLERWHARINLVGPGTLKDFWTRHALDSAQLWSLQPARRHWLDIGTGAGLPGLIIAALHCGTGARVTMVEASAKRCAFLREAARTLAVTDQTAIIHGKIEDVQAGLFGDPPDVVTARAFAGLDQLLDITAPYAERGALLLFPKGAGCDAEIEKASTRWRFAVSQHPSITDPAARVLEIGELTNRDLTSSVVDTR